MPLGLPIGSVYPPFGNLMASAKSFGVRGGFSNGLNPSIVGRIWYVLGNTSTSLDRGTVGSDSNSGLSPLTPLLTMTRALALVDSYDIIVMDGLITEQCVAPLNVYDVTIMGAANTPRQATSGGVYVGGGSTWKPPASPTATTPLLEIKAQGWKIENIEFTPHTSSAGVRLTRSASVDTIDASHASFRNCLFAANGGSGQIGIEDNGGSSFVEIDNVRFEELTGTAIKGISTANNVPLRWKVRGNYFLRNTNAIGMSSSQGTFYRNIFNQAANDTNFKVNLIAVAAQGDLNMVLENFFSDAVANVTIAKGYKPGTTDVWRNWVTDQADQVFVVPA